jgi:hypothetical protein
MGGHLAGHQFNIIENLAVIGRGFPEKYLKEMKNDKAILRR